MLYSVDVCWRVCRCSAYRRDLLGVENLLQLVLMEEDLPVLFGEKPFRTANKSVIRKTSHKKTKRVTFQKHLCHGQTKI